jgi:hypothetical protein
MLAGEIVLPDIQRDYVWKGSQVPRFLDSLNHQWPIGSVLLWKTRLDVPTKAAAVIQDSAVGIRPAILLDGQQRLTTLARIFSADRVPPGDHAPDVRYNPRTGQFRNANAVERRDKTWLSASDFLHSGAQFRDIVRRAGIAKDQTDEDLLTDHLKDVALRVRGYRLPIQEISEDNYERVAEIFNRVNTGGRRLSKGDLVMGALAARWRDGRRRIEDFESGLADRGWRLNREVLLRITGVIATGTPNHVRLVEIKDAAGWEESWQQTEMAVNHAVEFLVRDAEIPNLSLLPSEYLAVVPSVVMHRQKGVLKPGQAEALRQWVYVAGAFAHYSGSTETTLSSDMNLLGLADEPRVFGALLRDAQAPRTEGSPIAPQDLLGKGVRSPLLKLLQLRAVQTGARSWWSHRALSHGAPLPSLRVEVHHIFPKAWLRKQGMSNHAERDTIANFAFLSKFDNISISDKDPAAYLAAAEPAELTSQWIPTDPALWKAGRFSDFCARRRELLAEAINGMLGLVGPVKGDAPPVPDEDDEPETGAWAEDYADDPEAAG